LHQIYSKILTKLFFFANKEFFSFFADKSRIFIVNAFFHMQQTIKLNSKNQKLKKLIFHWISSSSNLVADRGVLDGVEGGGVAAVDPTLLEVPEG